MRQLHCLATYKKHFPRLHRFLRREPRQTHGKAPLKPNREPVSRLRYLMHVSVIILGWLLFAWCWWRVAGQFAGHSDLTLLVVGSLLVVPVMTLSWVFHNVRIHRRKGSRKASLPVALNYQRDFNGRAIQANWELLQGAPCVHIALENGEKCFYAWEGGQS